jgi:TolB protein
VIAFERKKAVYIANLDGTGQRKIADGIFPAISPDGTRVAFATVEKRSDTILQKLSGGYTYVRCIALVEIASGKNAVFRDIPSNNSYYATWSPDGNRLLFTLWQNEAWDLALINSDGSDFRVLKKRAQGEVSLYSPIWGATDSQFFARTWRTFIASDSMAPRLRNGKSTQSFQTAA